MFILFSNTEHFLMGKGSNFSAVVQSTYFTDPVDRTQKCSKAGLYEYIVSNIMDVETKYGMIFKTFF